MITVYNYKSVNIGSMMADPTTFVLYIMQSRGAVLGNPFYNRRDLTRTQRIDFFRVWFGKQLSTNPKVQEVIQQLTMMHVQNINIALICACKPQPCHGDIIKSYIESVVGGILCP